MNRGVARFIQEDQGQDLIEYAFLALFIALVITVALQSVGTALTTQFNNIGCQTAGC
jgi:Flp pilus assembly pilin Flp